MAQQLTEQTQHTHQHPHEHPHEHAHAPEHRTAQDKERLGHGAPVLDIGGDIGALVLYTDADLEGFEIDVSSDQDPGRRTHTEILKRTVGGRTFWAGVYAELGAGDYTVHWDDPSRPRVFSITGGSVTELDWR